MFALYVNLNLFVAFWTFSILEQLIVYANTGRKKHHRQTQSKNLRQVLRNNPCEVQVRILYVVRMPDVLDHSLGEVSFQRYFLLIYFLTANFSQLMIC